MEEKAFKEWMKAVDQLVSCEIGLSIHDLPDSDLRSCWIDDMTPEETADEIINEHLAGF